MVKSCYFCGRAGNCREVTPQRVLEGYHCKRFMAASDPVMEGREFVVQELGPALTTRAIAALRKQEQGGRTA